MSKTSRKQLMLIVLIPIILACLVFGIYYTSPSPLNTIYGYTETSNNTLEIQDTGVVDNTQSGSPRPSNETTTTIEMTRENIIICVLVVTVLILIIILACVISKKRNKGEK